MDLSAEGQAIANGTAVSINAVTTADAQLTQQQQIAALPTTLAPFADAPLNADILAQIQARLATLQNPVQLSLRTVYLAMHAAVGMQPAAHQLAANVAVANNNEMAVAPVSAIDRVGVESICWRSGSYAGCPSN